MKNIHADSANLDTEVAKICRKCTRNTLNTSIETRHSQEDRTECIDISGFLDPSCLILHTIISRYMEVV